VRDAVAAGRVPATAQVQQVRDLVTATLRPVEAVMHLRRRLPTAPLAQPLRALGDRGVRGLRLGRRLRWDLLPDGHYDTACRLRSVELAAIIINAGLFVATVIAAIIAWRSMQDAREARDAAAGHESRALAASETSASAATRSADALERQAELAEAAQQRSPWGLSSAGRKRWKLTNTSGYPMTDVQLTGETEGSFSVDGGNEPRRVRVNEGLYVEFGGGFTDPPSMTIRIDWTDAALDPRSSVFTIP
jgi:hypothetical protein